MKTLRPVLLMCTLLALNATSVLSQWQRVWDNSTGVRRLYTSSVGTGVTNLYACMGRGIYRSSSNGGSWSALGLSNEDVSDVVAVGGNIFASVQNQPSSLLGVHKSTNNGGSWDTVNSGFGSSPFIHSVALFNSSLYAGKRLSGFFRSTNEGLLWTQVNAGLPTTSLPTPYHLVVSGSRLLAATDDGFLVYDGSLWAISNAGLPATTVRAISVSPSDSMKIFIGTDAGIYRSVDGGNNWSAANNGIPAVDDIYCLLTLNISNTVVLLAGSDRTGVYRSFDDGANWHLFNDGLASGVPTATALAVSDTFLFLGISSSGSNIRGIWRRPLQQIVSSVNQASNEVPAHFGLAQNYPNPFNPSTNIKFQIPNSNFVTLRVYDILGKEVATLVNEQLNPGSYETTFDGVGLASGVYFYRLQVYPDRVGAGSFVQTRKLVLQK